MIHSSSAVVEERGCGVRTVGLGRCSPWWTWRRGFGATIRYGGTVPAVIIGDGERPWWDAILIVEYPSPTAFIDMVTTEEYAKVHAHRAAALERGDLIATSTWSIAE